MVSYSFAVFIFCTLAATVLGHGRLREPPGRSSLWRNLGDPEISPYASIVEANYNDNQLFCGGFSHQKSLGGMCGVCGDPFDAAEKPNEAGGKYAKGIIVRQYSQGETIEAKIQITAHHKGYFEFRLCPWNDRLSPVTHECLNSYVLDTGTAEVTKYILPESIEGIQWYDVPLKLPDDVTCTQCVLQWKYHTGNSWGCDEGGGCCVGCGPQEEFYGCADIAIGESINPPPSTTEGTPGSTTTTTGASTTPPLTTSSTTTTTDGNTVGCQPGDEGLKFKTCVSYYMCIGSTSYPYDCPPGTVFNSEISLCDHPYNTKMPCGTLP